MSNTKKQPTKLSEIIPDNRNANKHSQYGMGLLENSTRMNGLGRSILISEDNVIIAGNGVAESAGSIGIEKVRVIETDGNEVIAVKRVDIKSGTKEFYTMALADNIVAQKNIVMDAEVVEALAVEHKGVKFWADIVNEEGFDGGGGGLPDADKANKTEVKLQLSNIQAAKLKKAIALSKQINKAKFPKTDNDNSNGNAVAFIADFYIKNAGKVKASIKK